MERVDANLVPFAQNNPSGYRFAFGTDTATDDINVNYNDNIKKGWGTTPNEFPEVEDFNAMVYTIGYLLSYLYHMGIAEWNNKQKYRQYSRVIGSDGIIYKAKTGTDISPNVDNNPTSDTTNWEIDNQFNINSLASKTTPVDADNFGIQETGGLFKKLSWVNLKATLKNYFDTLYITLSGNQTIGGIKNFTSKILSPDISYKDTPITITSWSYSGITITLTVASHTFVVGDYIEVAGLTATTYPANGIHLITSVTSTTIVFTLSATPTGTAGVSSATVRGYVTINGRVSESIGVNQTWQDVTASRVLGTTYTNSTGKPIAISVIANNTTPGSFGVSGSVGGNLIVLSFVDAINGTGYNTSIFFIVPPGQTYSVAKSGVSQTNIWKELR